MDLLEHDAKRKVEVELAMLREDLEEGGGYTEEQIEEKISKKRKELMKGIKITLMRIRKTRTSSRPRRRR